MSDYIIIKNDSNELSVSNLLSSWHLESILTAEEYLVGYKVNMEISRFYCNSVRETMPSTMYYAMLPNDSQSMYVVSNPTDDAVYICSGYKVLNRFYSYDRSNQIVYNRYLGDGISIVF